METTDVTENYECLKTKGILQSWNAVKGCDAEIIYLWDHNLGAL